MVGEGGAKVPGVRRTFQWRHTTGQRDYARHDHNIGPKPRRPRQIRRETILGTRLPAIYLRAASFINILRGLAFVDRSHRGRGLGLRLVDSAVTDENESFALFGRFLGHDHAFVRFRVLNDIEASSQGGRRHTNREDRS